MMLAVKQNGTGEGKLSLQLYVQAIIVFTALAFGVFLGWLSFCSQQLIIENALPDKAVCIKDIISLWTDDYTISEEGIYQTDMVFETPLLYMDLSKYHQEIQTLALVVDEYNGIGFNSEDHLMAKLLVSDGKRAPYSESDFYITYAGDDERTLVFQLPKKQYGEIAVSIHGSFRLTNVFVSPNTPLSNIKTNIFRIKACVFPCIMLMIFLEVLYCFRRSVLDLLLMIKSYSRKIILFVFSSILGCVCAYCVGYIVFRYILHQNYHFYRSVFFCSAGVLSASLFLLRKKLAHNPELAFASIALSAGMMLALVMPVASLVSWDDPIHYRGALALSNSGTSIITAADDEIIDRRFATLSSYEDHSINIDHARYLNRIHQQSAVYVDEYPIKSSYIGYLPFSLALWIGRLFHMPFSVQFVMGRVLSVLLYVLIIFQAIRQLRYGKVLLSAIALIPTALFLSSNYSYDGWIIAFTLLGTSLYISELQHIDKPMSVSKEVLMIIVFIVGILPKPVYLPIMFMLLAMPKQKFRTAKGRKIYYLIFVIGMMIAILLLAQNILQDTSVLTDSRGEGYIDGKQQMIFILENPFRYAYYMLRYFISSYFDFDNVADIVTAAGNWSHFKYFFSGHTAILLVLLFSAMTDFKYADEFVLSKHTDAAIRTITGLSVFAAIAFITTTMYIAFNSVGYSEIIIEGVQGRYFLPLMLAGLSLLHTRRIQNRIPRHIYNSAVFLTLIISLYSNIWQILLRAN